jgi:hypothetical protein
VTSKVADRPDSAAAHGRQHLRFVASIDEARAVGGLEPTVILDTAWTPRPSDPPHLVSIRPLVAGVVEGHDLFEEALALVDAWADATRARELLLVAGVSYWFRVRENAWHWAHERLLWQLVLAGLDGGAAHGSVSVPWAESALIDVLRAQGRSVEVQGAPATRADPAPSGGPRAAGRFIPSAVRRAVRRVRPRPESASVVTNRRRIAFLGERLERLAGLAKPRIIVVTLPSSYQRIGPSEQGHRQDPNLGSVIPALAAAGLEPIVVGWGMNRAKDEDWATVELDDRLLPAWFLQARWGRPEDDDRARAAVVAVLAPLAAMARTPFDLAGVDLTAGLLAMLRADLERIVNADVHELARVERLISDLEPGAMLMSQEGHRTGWLIAADRATIPTFAIQHGVLYPTHPGYPSVRHPAQVLPSCTFVYGDYERRVLLAGAYHEAEVEASGSPRLELDPGRDPLLDSVVARAAERAGVRRELGLAEADRLLVVSTVNLEFARRSHLVHMIERTLGGPLPGVHVVFKQHPGERDQGPYRALMEGLAAAGGYDPAPISVVRDIDLYRLLRAADAHLGLHSTVLTDSVAAGTPNLIAIVEGHADLLGYVAAGVARPVASVGDVLAALDRPVAADPVARQAFLDDHFRPGVPSRRIVDAIGARLG